jgi:cellulose synthase/poly-beta-1,6-N-acetylglucosamine synthase-like glycosyltransferase
MRISFVVPAYNEESRIGACVQSIQREIERAHAVAEIIVVNNASTDTTRATAEHAGATVIDESRKGLTRARQTGFEHSAGELIANIDADVLIPPGWLDTVLARFDANPALVALSGPFIYYDLSLPQRILVRLFYAGGLTLSILGKTLTGRGAMLQGGNFVLRRTALEKMGGFDTSIEFYGEDTDTARRIAAHGKVLWTFSLPVLASGRRLAHEGVLRTGLRYALNFFSVSLFGKPVHKTYTDIRPTV